MSDSRHALQRQWRRDKGVDNRSVGSNSAYLPSKGNRQALTIAVHPKADNIDAAS
jgi:hypothetical protein